MRRELRIERATSTVELNPLKFSARIQATSSDTLNKQNPLSRVYLAFGLGAGMALGGNFASGFSGSRCDSCTRLWASVLLCPGGAKSRPVFDNASHNASSWKAIVPPPRFLCEIIRLMSPTQTQSDCKVMPH